MTDRPDAPTPQLPGFDNPTPLVDRLESEEYYLADLGLTVEVVKPGGKAWTFPADLPVESEEA